jgi:tRNA (cytidine/uridine-2'-O-)-methyltransferase
VATVFLYAPQIFHNVCLLARTLEVFAYRECWVFDPNGLIRDRYGKVRTRELRNVSAGAFEKISWRRVEDPDRVLGEYRGRVVATVAEPSAVPLTHFGFASDDLLLFGSESRGLPEAVRARADAAITIPSHGVTQSLNLAVAAGVVLYERQRQLERG